MAAPVTGIPELRPALGSAAPVTVLEVVAQLRAIVAALPPGDGIGAFTTLYLAVTESVEQEASGFEDPDFVRSLDIVFATIFFDALRIAAVGGSPPKAWSPLLEARGRPGIVPLQFALAGMNAHINRDLPLALVETCRLRGVELRRRSPQRRDFRRIDELLARTEERVKPQLVTGFAGEIDVALGRLDDVLALWKVERAREAAWVHAETLWALQPLPQQRARFLRTLDRLVGFAGRGLLRPIGHLDRPASRPGS